MLLQRCCLPLSPNRPRQRLPHLPVFRTSSCTHFFFAGVPPVVSESGSIPVNPDIVAVGQAHRWVNHTHDISHSPPSSAVMYTRTAINTHTYPYSRAPEGNPAYTSASTPFGSRERPNLRRQRHLQIVMDAQSHRSSHSDGNVPGSQGRELG